jgi:ribosomal protein L7Ae-like RNA K-turn-binding protein
MVETDAYVEGNQQDLVPSLIILAGDVRPATIFSHIPIYAHLLKVPVLIMPGKASEEFGNMLGIKSIAAAMFLSPSSIEKMSDVQLDAHIDINSFINFAISKIKK